MISYLYTRTLANIATTRSALRIIQEIEQKGGSAAFEKWLQRPEPEKRQFDGAARVLGDPSTTVNGVAVTIWSAGIYTSISAEGSGINGSGGAWGLGLGYMDGIGILVYSGALSNVSSFYIQAAGEDVEGAEVELVDGDGTLVGSITVVGDGLLEAVGFAGNFSFRSVEFMFRRFDNILITCI